MTSKITAIVGIFLIATPWVECEEDKKVDSLYQRLIDSSVERVVIIQDELCYQVKNKEKLNMLVGILSDLPGNSSAFPTFSGEPDFIVILRSKNGKFSELNIFGGIIVVAESGAAVMRAGDERLEDTKYASAIIDWIKECSEQ